MENKFSGSRIEIEYVQKVSDCIFPSADWSVINVPESQEDSVKLSKLLYNTPQSNHICLLLNRHPRKKRILTLANPSVFVANSWQYLETVNISYDKPSSCSNHGLLPVSETGHVFFKGVKPSTQNTEWFSDGNYNNATNFWDISARDSEGENSYYQRFSAELNLLLRSLCGPLSTRKFIYAVDSNAEEIHSIFNFCKTYDFCAKVYFFDSGEAKRASLILEGLIK
jgi:hypothetical protein